MRKDMMYFDLSDACAEPGCPVCRISLKSVRSYLNSIMSGYVNNSTIRAKLRKAHGFCNKHAWWLHDGYGSVLGIAIIQHDIVKNVLDTINIPFRGRSTRKRARNLLKHLRPSAECPACVHRREMEDIAIHTLLKYISDKDLTVALANSSGICLPHFLRALELVQNADTLKQLVDLEQRALAKLRDELAEFIRKNDYRFMGEGFGKEGNSWLRAISIISGEPDVR